MRENCPVYGGVDLITVASAAQLTGLNLATLYHWIYSQKVHSIRSAHNKLLLCYQSLTEAMISQTYKIKQRG